MTNSVFLYSIAFVIVIVCVLILLLIKRNRNNNIEREPMEGAEFENYCALLLEDNGFEEVHQTPVSHDFGCDIIAKKDHITYGIQCKSYSTPVGISAIQQAYAGKDFYDCMVGAVMTNSTFTAPAREMADKLKVVLWDGQTLEQMEE